jgi:hypothetical protein
VLLTAFRPDYRPANAQRIEVVVRRRDVRDGEGEGQEILREPALMTDAQGEARLRFKVEQAGLYEIEARADLVEGRQTTARDLFVGVDTNPELERIVADPRFPEAMAGLTGGKSLGPSSDFDEVPVRAPTVMRVRNRAFVELWNSTWALLLFGALFGLEWWLRRRFGYL